MRPEPPEPALGDGPDASPGTGSPPSIAPTDRVLTVGMTGSGKSELLAHLWSIYPGQRVLIDVTDAYELPAGEEADTCEAERVSEIDWSVRTIRFVPRSHGEGTYDDLYAALWQRAATTGGLCVWLDEAQGPTSANRAPRWLRTAVTQGRKRGIFHLAATQEPVNVLPAIITQANHLMLFRLAGRPADLNALRHRLGVSADELAAEIERLPQFGYLRSTLGDATLYAMPPLPRSVLDHTTQHVRLVA